MKIAGKTVKGFVVKTLASGTYYGWEPTPLQRKAGWKSFKLEARDLGHAIQLCEDQNAKVAQWRTTGAAPAHVKRYIAPNTFGSVLDRYERAVLAHKSENTRRVDRTAINTLRAWAGDKPAKFITRARVKALRDAMMRELKVELDGPGHSTVFHLLTTLRKILGWWIDDADLGIPNPADRFGLRAPTPRDQIWERDAQLLMHDACAALGAPSIALAFDIATYTGQRQADVLTIPRSRWQEITPAQLGHDQRLYDALKSDHGPDAGKVMGIYVKQGKTKRWVGVPIEGELRDRIEATIATTLAAAKAANAIPPAEIIVNDAHGRAWGQSDFIHTFGEIRDAAATVAMLEGNDELADRIATLQFRDLRRTCIVTLGQLGLNDYQIASITGHSQATIKRILEVYMPRTEAAAASAVVARIGDQARRADQTARERQA